MAGQVIMQGFLRRQSRSGSAAGNHGPALLVIVLGLDPNPNFGHQPGGAELWTAFCDHPIDHFYLPAKADENIGQPPNHDPGNLPGNGSYHQLEYLLTHAYFYRKMIWL